MDRKESGELKISAAIANHRPPTRSEPTGRLLTGEKAVRTSNTTTSDESRKLPPSPLVTPPMGSNPSQAAQKAISPRNLLPADAISKTMASETTYPTSNNTTATEKQLPETKGSPGSKNHHQQHHQQQRGIPHVYHDYAKVSGPGAAFIRKKTGGVTQPFPDKLHEMLSHESSDDPARAIVSWLPHGRAFIVRKPKEFTTEIMPKYFRQTKLTSFQRQLNLYGFRRITQGADSGAYYHPLFLQGRPSLSQRMVRQKVKGTGHKQPSDASSEPNFYSMPPVEPEYPNQQQIATPYGEPFSNNQILMPPLQQAPAAVPLPPSQHLLAAQPPRAAVPPPTQGPPVIDPNSPGFSSLHGAAQLLHGIAAGKGGGAFLGPPATTNNKSASSKTAASATAKQKPASFLLPDDIARTEV